MFRHNLPSLRCIASIRRRQPCSSSSCCPPRVRLRLWKGVLSDSSTTLPCPTRTQPGMVLLARLQPIELISARSRTAQRTSRHTLFLNCLCIASSASLMVTPFRFRATTSIPVGNLRSIFLTGGLVSIFLRTPGSSIELEDWLIFLQVVILRSAKGLTRRPNYAQTLARTHGRRGIPYQPNF